VRILLDENPRKIVDALRAEGHEVDSFDLFFTRDVAFATSRRVGSHAAC
jgi:hypothetical protein